MTRISRKKQSKSKYRTKKTHQRGGNNKFDFFGGHDFRSQQMGNRFSSVVAQTSTTGLAELLYNDIPKILLENRNFIKTNEYNEILKNYRDKSGIDELKEYDKFIKSGNEYMIKLHEMNLFGKNYGGHGIESSKDIETLNKFYERMILDAQIHVVSFLKSAKTIDLRSN